MHRLEKGMAVYGIRGRRVGVVSEIGQHCFEVRRTADDGGPVCLMPDSIFTVERRLGVTLICGKDDVDRYRCMEHAEAERASD